MSSQDLAEKLQALRARLARQVASGRYRTWQRERDQERADLVQAVREHYDEWVRRPLTERAHNWGDARFDDDGRYVGFDRASKPPASEV